MPAYDQLLSNDPAWSELYASLRWPGWEADAEQVEADRALSLDPCRSRIVADCPRSQVTYMP